MVRKYNPYVNWKIINDEKCLYFKFYGVLRLDEAEKAIKRWNKLIDREEHNRGSIDDVLLVWDCSEMKNYETNARIVWQQNLKKQGRKITIVWLITKSPIVQAGAEIISFFTSYTIRTVKSIEELETILLK